MADLIDRDALLKDLRSECPESEVYISGEACIDCIVKRQPVVNRWISVEDALPDALQNVLVCTDINTVTVAWINGDGWTFADTGGGHTENWGFDDVKYWMPLPETPKEDDND